MLVLLAVASPGVLLLSERTGSLFHFISVYFPCYVHMQVCRCICSAVSHVFVGSNWSFSSLFCWL